MILNFNHIVSVYENTLSVYYIKIFPMFTTTTSHPNNPHTRYAKALKYLKISGWLKFLWFSFTNMHSADILWCLSRSNPLIRHMCLCRIRILFIVHLHVAERLDSLANYLKTIFLKLGGVFLSLSMFLSSECTLKAGLDLLYHPIKQPQFNLLHK